MAGIRRILPDRGDLVAHATVRSDAAEAAARRIRLRRAAEAFFAALDAKDFDAIPYHPPVVFRAPIAPGGRHFPLLGRDVVRSVWWPPLVPILWGTRILEHFYNDSDTAIVTVADIYLRAPRVTLRVADRFEVDENGQIIDQENYFDPRDATTPRWNEQRG